MWPQALASMRSYRGEEGVFFAKVRQPELLSLLEELDALVRHHKQLPVESIPEFRQRSAAAAACPHRCVA